MSGSGGSWHCDKYVTPSGSNLLLEKDKKSEWNLISVEGKEKVYVIQESAGEKRYWYDDPNTDKDWISLRSDKKSHWLITPRGKGYGIRLVDTCETCKRDVTWKGSGMQYKYLYAGPDEYVTFRFTAV